LVVTHFVLAASGYIDDVVDLSWVGRSAALPAQPASLPTNLVLILLGDPLVVGGVSPLAVIVLGTRLHLITVTLGAPTWRWLVRFLRHSHWRDSFPLISVI
jgi:hypothetical protein